MPIKILVHFSKEDGEYVARCKKFPYLSFLASSESKAIQGFKELLNME